MFRLDRLYKRRLAQTTRSADVNIVDEIDQPEGLELSEPSTFPAGEQPSKQILFHPTKQLQQPRSVVRAPRAEFGVNLDELAAPSVGGISTDNPADNHQSENDYEDPDLKMGQVEEPYSMSSGPMNIRFDDDKKYDIVKGAQVGSDAVSYVTNELKLSPDAVADNLITQIEGIRDQLASLDVPSVRKSVPIANVRHGPNVFTFTVVVDARWGGDNTIVLDADVALNGTGRSNASFNIPADASGLDGIVELWDFADTVWSDLVSAVEANLYWLDTEVGSVDMPKEGVGLIEGPAMDENIHGNDFGRLDQAIPRDPAKEDLLYPR